MRRFLLYYMLSLVFLFFDCQLAFAQYTSSDWMNDKPFQDIMEGLGSVRVSPNNSGARKRKDRYNAYEAEMERRAAEAMRRAAIEAERLAEEARKRAEEAERIRKEEEFKADKAGLQGSLRGSGTYSFSSGYKSELRGFSQDKSIDNKYSSGLKGFYNKSSLSKERSYYSNGLRGYSDNEQQQVSNLHTSVPEITDANCYEDFSHRPTSKNLNNNINTTKIENRLKTETTFNNATNQNNRNYIVDNYPSPFNNNGTYVFVYRTGTSEHQEESLLEKWEQQIDVWREKGKHETLTYLGDKITGFARKTISSRSAISAQVVKVYDILRDIAGIKNLEMNIVNTNLKALKKTVATGDARYANEAMQYSQKKVIDYRNTYFEDKGIIPPSHRKIKKEVRKVNKELGELWVSSIIAK